MSSVTKKRRTVDVDWVAGLFQRIPDECIKKTPELQNYVEQWGKFKAAVPFPSVRKLWMVRYYILPSADFIYALDRLLPDL